MNFATHKVRLVSILLDSLNFLNLILNYDLFKKQEAQLKWSSHFQELFDETHKKRGTDDYISERA